jgi:hypothetical protein
MMRASLIGLLIVTVLTEMAHAQKWAERMFTVRSHDFGTVARGSKAEFAFELTNRYVEDVHIASVRATCGCTTPRIEKQTLKTYEKGAIIAHINSDRFLGSQGATLTVTIDKPFYAQVQLQVKVYVYSDVLLEPASVELGNVERGKSIERTLRVRYTGRSDWRIVEVRSDNPHVQGTVTETSRQGGRITYELKAVLDQGAPPGYVNESLWLVTNDARRKKIPVTIEGRVTDAITVSPESLFLGTVRSGQTVEKRIVVRGQRPFRITAVRGDCPCLEATVPQDQENKSMFLVPIKFTARQKAGKIKQTLDVETDAGQTVLKVTVNAMVDEP